MRSSKFYGTALFSVLMIGIPVRSISATHSVAVLEFDVGSDSILSPGEQQRLTETVRGLARRSLPRENWTVLTQKNMEEKISSGSSVLNCGDEACALVAGQKLQADYVVAENVGRIGSYLQASFSIYDVASGRLVSSEWPRGKTTDDIVDSLKTSPNLFAVLSGSNTENPNLAEGNSRTVIIHSYPAETRVVYRHRPVYINPVACVFVPILFLIVFASAFEYHGR